VKNKQSMTLIASILLLALILIPDVAIGRDLGSAAKNAVSSAKLVTRALSIFGLLVGGAFMQIPGLADFGKRVLGAGLVGCLCAFGGPTIISFFESVFGGM
jgi:hypothetical protein